MTRTVEHADHGDVLPVVQQVAHKQHPLVVRSASAIRLVSRRAVKPWNVLFYLKCNNLLSLHALIHNYLYNLLN
jgi:hypothetical protein